MLNFKKLAVASITGAIALGSSLYATNIGVPVQNNAWQLVGVTGLYTYDPSGGTSLPTLNIGDVDIALIDIVDTSDTMTWDANSSRGNALAGSNGDFNGYCEKTSSALDGCGTASSNPTLFTDDGTLTGTAVMTVENNGSTTGMPYHSIVGVKGLNHSDSDLGKVAISFNYDKTVNFKNYESPMRVMYIKSDEIQYSTAQPDVMVVYQASMEGQTFKIQFSDTTTVDVSSSRSAQPFVWTASTETNAIYAGTFSQDYNWDAPATTTSGLTKQTTSTTSTSGTTYGKIEEVFDMNLIGMNAAAPGGTATDFTYDLPTHTSSGTTYDTLDELEGNLTVYEWSNTGDDTTSEWKPAWFYRASTTGAIGVDSQNEITSFTPGKGYWVRFNALNGSNFPPNYNLDDTTTDSIPGFLVSDSITGSDYNTSLIKEGWNLLAFEDEYLRKSTAGLVVPFRNIDASNSDMNITGPFGEKVLAFANADLGATPTSACQTINRSIDGNNTQATQNSNKIASTNTLNIRCYPNSDGNITLISDRSFFVDISIEDNTHSVAGSTQGAPRTLTGTSLLGYYDHNWSASGASNFNGYGTSSDAIRYRARYGEYVAAVNINSKALDHDNVAQKMQFEISIPPSEHASSWTSSSNPSAIITLNSGVPNAWKGALKGTTRQFIEETVVTDMDTDMATLASNSSPVSYGEDIGYSTTQGVFKAWMIAGDGDGTDADGNETLLIASNKRFFVRDKTFIQLFNVNWLSVQGMAATAAKSGSTGTVQINNTSDYVPSSATLNSTAWADCDPGNALEAGTTGVYLYCIDQHRIGGTAGVDLAGSDSNNTIMFIANAAFDVREANMTTDYGVTTYGTYSDAGDQLSETTVSSSISVDANETVYGALKEVYLGSSLASASVTTGGATSPSAKKSNLTYTPVWADDFPNDGPLYYISQVADSTGSAYLKPEVILTAVTASTGQTSATGELTNNEITWKALDVTRDPAEWYDDANNFELFWTEKGRGYWVYASGGYTSPVTAAGATSSYTVYKHFKNVTVNNYAPTYNHIDGTVEVDVGGLYRTGGESTYTSGASYNVEANIGGTREQMVTTSGVASASSVVTFTVPVNDYETAGISANQATPLSISFQAVDGLGGKATTSYSLPFNKPSQPKLYTYASNPAITLVDSTYANYIYLWEGNISDTSYESGIKLVTDGTTISADPDGDGTSSDYLYVDTSATSFTSQFTYPTALDPASAPTDLTSYDSLSEVSAALKDVRYVTSTHAQASITEAIFSDQYAQTFAPVYAGTHVLEAAAGASDADPARFENTDPTPTGVNHGVQLNNVTASYSAALAYPPVAGTPGLAGDFTHTIHVGDSTGVFATISYNSAYVGKYFYMYVNGQMYVSVFPKTSVTTQNNTDASGNPLWLQMYNISGSTQSIQKPSGA